ncbi:MAG TPA: hypothetical protein VFL91_16745 [Thermomicrobiales bacterium]|nr:hypothetical protein [Thermomicrobiales bacterium]
MDTEQDLIARWVERNPHRPGIAEARVVGYGVPVWALAGYLLMVEGDAERVAGDYDLPRDAVAAALAYYRRHQAVIDARIAANAE